MYIWNSNHNRTHVPGCRAVTDMMTEEHKVPVEEPRGHLCGWCLRGGASVQPSFDESLDAYIGEETCTDPTIRELLKRHGCTCGSHLGDVRMYPHTAGVRVPGRDGTWWIYFTCFNCGHETSLSKVPAREDVVAHV